ncbi:MAG: ArsR/SmtB family transcription factor [Jatrophihabitans sp.]
MTKQARRPASDAEARALASTLRIRILRTCLGEAHTNKEIADLLHRDPGGTLHHVRMLVRTGFLMAQPERRGARGAREIPYLATGKSWTLSSPAKHRVLLDAFLEEVGQVPVDALDTARLGLRLPTRQMDEFLLRMQGLLDEYAALPDDPDAPPMSIFFAVHPDITRAPARSV